MTSFFSLSLRLLPCPSVGTGARSPAANPLRRRRGRGGRGGGGAAGQGRLGGRRARGLGVAAQVHREHPTRRHVSRYTDERLRAGIQILLQGDQQHLQVVLRAPPAKVPRQLADVARVQRGVHLVEHKEGRRAVAVDRKQQRQRRQRLLPARELVDVAELLARRDGVEDHAVLKRLVLVLQREVRRPPTPPAAVRRRIGRRRIAGRSV